MEESRSTLASFVGFAENFRGPLAKVVRASSAMQRAAGLFPGIDASLFSETALGQVARQVEGVYETPIAQVFAGAWRKSPEVREYCDAAKHPPGEASVVELLEHTVTWTRAPEIELVVGEAAVGTFLLELKVDLTLKGGVLVIQDGKFMELQAGTLQIAASIGHEDQPVAAWEGSRELPRGLSFGEGIPICPPAKAAPEPAAVVEAGTS